MMSRTTLHNLVFRNGALASHSLVLLLAGFALCLGGCSKDVSSTEVLPAQSFSTSDANAGDWRMVVLSGPTQIAVAAPAPVTDPTYRSELAQVKAAQAKLTDAQKTLHHVLEQRRRPALE